MANHVLLEAMIATPPLVQLAAILGQSIHPQQILVHIVDALTMMICHATMAHFSYDCQHIILLIQ